MRWAAALVTLAAAALAAAPVAAHHASLYAPKDNAITTNFKAVKFSVEAGKFDVARRLFDRGPLRAEMRARAAVLPPGLEARTRAALEAGHAAGVERELMVFFAVLARELALEADRQLAAGAEAAAIAPRFLEAIWRYYNLVDFAVAGHDARASVAMRLAYDEADGLVKPGATPATMTAGPVRESFQRIGTVLAGVIEVGMAAR